LLPPEYTICGLAVSITIYCLFLAYVLVLISPM